MNQIEGASLKDAFKLMGQGSTKKPKVVDKSPAPRDDEPNDLNRINFEENIKYIVERYDKIINELVDEINSLKLKVKPSPQKKKLVEAFDHSSTPFLTEQQVNELIYLLFCGIVVVCVLNYFFNFP